MARFKLTIEYAGTRYSGWQIQQNARTVQGEIDRAVREVSGRTDFELYGSGRTDAGVHALFQVAHLDVFTRLPAESLRRQLNDLLPADINILTAEPAPHRFHARHDAVARSYLYQIATRRTAFAKPFVWWVKEPLDVAAMREAAAAFVGMRDFHAFTEQPVTHASTLVLVEGITIQPDGDLLLVRVEGSHFLWRMVRRLVGVLAEVGRGGLAPGATAGLLTAPGGLPARLTAPASGLFLERVFYEGDVRQLPLRPVFNMPVHPAPEPGSRAASAPAPAPAPPPRHRPPGARSRHRRR
ncbi:MAG TPA: tRNA pseudouridine(38-40) synthase TruA [Vicinamibacterales bacterium]|nr:tRNA pseudouridine(38-40) synthase TruA [Vicinamibacterales bacterium]